MPNIFLKFDPAIDGGSRDDKFSKWIVIQSFSWGVTNPPPDAKGDLPSAPESLNLSGVVDRQSPRLFEAAAKGTLFTSAELDVASEGADEQVFYKVRISDVFITSYQVGGAESGPGLNEQYAISYRKLENEFRPQNEDGSLGAPITGSFDWPSKKV
jgi:type VI secretion system secreted protein Hcp